MINHLVAHGTVTDDGFLTLGNMVNPTANFGKISGHSEKMLYHKV